LTAQMKIYCLISAQRFCGKKTELWFF